MNKINLKVADITEENVCAVVNAANSSLMGGGGVDGAIHRRGGSLILEECKKIRKEEYPNGLPTGEAVYTTAGNMPSKYVIHTVGPIYRTCLDDCELLLANCYKNSLDLAVKLGCSSISFPAVSTGVYGFPKPHAAKISYDTVKEYLKDIDNMEVNFVFSNEQNKEVFEEAIK